MFYIYLIKCQTNDKLYVGQTARTIPVRFQEHLKDARKGKTTCRKLYSAIRKYGENNFFIEQIDLATTQEETDTLERYYIKQLNTIKQGYNLQIGGYNGPPSEETRKLMSEQRKGEKNVMFGKHHSQSTKDAISKANKGKIGPWKGKSISQDIRDKISQSRKGITVGENNPGAKLNASQVEEIKTLLQSSDYTSQQIADMFNVSLSTIKRIKAGTHWK